MDGIGFIGEFTHTLDPKGRVFIPKKYLEAMPQDQPRVLFITKGLDGCLTLFTAASWKQTVAQLMTKAEGDEETRHFRRVFFSFASDQAIDGSGRILIPEKHRREVGLEREVLFVGMVDRIELWDRQRWEAVYGGKATNYEVHARGVLRP